MFDPVSIIAPADTAFTKALSNPTILDAIDEDLWCSGRNIQLQICYI